MKKCLLWVIVIALLMGLGVQAQAADVLDLTPTGKIMAGYADTSLGQVHYRYIKGTDDKLPVLIMIHQTTSDSTFYEFMMPIMAKYYSAIYCPDFPGYGGFEPTDEQVEAKGLAFYGDVFVEFMDSLNIKKCHLAGHYSGGSMALDMKYRYPDRFYSLTVMGPIYGDQEFRKRLREVSVGSVQKLVPVRDGWHLLRGWKQVEEYGAAALPLELHQREALINLKGWKATKQAYNAVLDYDFIKPFDNVPGPLLIMDGSKGQCFEFFEAAKKARPDAVSLVLEGCHDYFPYEKPNEVAAAIISFTKDVDKTTKK